MSLASGGWVTVTRVKIEIIRLASDLPLPTYAFAGDAGCDLYANAATVLAPRGGRSLVPTGIKIGIPQGYAGFIQPRSGLALRYGVTVLNSPGLIDSGYRDEVGVILVNLGSEQFVVERGDRIAQLVVQAIETVDLTIAEDKGET